MEGARTEESTAKSQVWRKALYLNGLQCRLYTDPVSTKKNSQKCVFKLNIQHFEIFELTKFTVSHFHCALHTVKMKFYDNIMQYLCRKKSPCGFLVKNTVYHWKIRCKWHSYACIVVEFNCVNGLKKHLNMSGIPTVFTQ